MNTQPLRLEADDPTVRDRTNRALEESESLKAAINLRCSQCGTRLADVGDTPTGPLFGSSWTVETEDPHLIIDNGQALGAREKARYMSDESEIEFQSGPPLKFVEQHGTIALLALPAHLPQDFPDLMVRCPKHGDAVLDRLEVLKWLRIGKSAKVRVDFPHREYRRPVADGRGETVRSTVVTRMKADAMPVDQLRKRLGMDPIV